MTVRKLPMQNSFDLGMATKHAELHRIVTLAVKFSYAYAELGK